MLPIDETAHKGGPDEMPNFKMEAIMIYKVVDLETFEQSYSGTSLDAALEAWVSAEGEVVFVMYWDASVGGWRTFGEVPD